MALPHQLALSVLLAAAPPIESDPLPAVGQDGPFRDPGTPTVLYINFDGGLLREGCANDPQQNCSTLSGFFDGYVGPFSGGEAQEAGIFKEARRDLAPYGVEVVGRRPPEGAEYTMILYGDLGPQAFAGVAPYIDCGDSRQGDTAFSQGFTSANQGGTVVVHEAGHTWGLEHVNRTEDNMHPIAEGIAPIFRDECLPIVANTDLDPAVGSCNTIHTLFCDPGFQNSHQELLYLFGPPIEDTLSPTIEILTPGPNALHYLPEVVPVRAFIDDNLHPQVYDLEIILGGEVVFEGEVWDQVDLPFTLTDPGDYTVTLRITDEAGNSSEDTRTFLVRDGFDPSQLPEGGCRVAPGGGARWPAALLLLLPLAVRRRPRFARRA